MCLACCSNISERMYRSLQRNEALVNYSCAWTRHCSHFCNVNETCCLSAVLWDTGSVIFFISDICAQSHSPTNALHRDFQTCKSDWWCSTWRTPTRIIVIFKEKVLPVLLGRASNRSGKNSQFGETNSIGNSGASVRSNWLWHEPDGLVKVKLADSNYLLSVSRWSRIEIH